MKHIAAASSLGIAALGALLLPANPAPAQNAANGAALYKGRCQMCHSGAANSIGPNLKGVVGRKAGSTGFNYSTAMKNSKLVWTKASLDKFIANPAKTVPGTKMVVSVADAAQRAAIVDQLATMK